METNATALPFASTMGEPDCPASVAVLFGRGAKGIDIVSPLV
jgi:hypothetical protein